MFDLEVFLKLTWSTMAFIDTIDIEVTKTAISYLPSAHIIGMVCMIPGCGTISYKLDYIVNYSNNLPSHCKLVPCDIHKKFKLYQIWFRILK